MKQLITQGIVLARTNYGEADRILTIITPEFGKIRVIAKGVRRAKSKLAGGIELLSVSEIGFIKGKSDIGTVVSSRLKMHYGGIVKDMTRTTLAYECIKQLNKATEDECESKYFYVLEQAFMSLDDGAVIPYLTQLWFSVQLLLLAGHAPNVMTDSKGERLSIDKTYSFSFEDMTFNSSSGGKFTPAHIKLLRLLLSGTSPTALMRVEHVNDIARQLTPLVDTLRTQSLGA